MVSKEIKVAPAYVTSDVLFADKTNGYLTQWIPHTYQLVPQGLVFNLAVDQVFHNPPDPHLRTRGLADGTLRFADDDVVKLKVLPVYARMLTNRGRYLAAFNQYERAMVSFKEALALDPNLTAAQQGLDESTAKLRNP
jgi:tetratricopeptide (TPR) repeat protein